VQSGSTKYVVVRTDQTPSNISDSEAEKAYDESFKKENKKQKDAGKSSKEAFKIATEKAAADVAKKYKVGLYQGTDCAKLSRVSP
jgi:hypothetical protein